VPVDLMLDRATGDLVATAGNDVALVSGAEEVGQRIRTHVLVQLGSYQLEPRLGSSANSLLRLSIEQAVAQLPLVVKEALAQMDDIVVSDVEAWADPEDVRKVRFNVRYSTHDAGSAEPIVFSDSLVVTS
jgi:hypothetical protein